MIISDEKIFIVDFIWDTLYLIKIPLQILQKLGIILFFILSSKGPFFIKKSSILVSYPLCVSFKASQLIHNKGRFHKFFKKGIGGQIREDWSSDDETTTLDIIRIADFINKVVATRRLK